MRQPSRSVSQATRYQRRRSLLYEQAHSSDWGAPPTVPQGFAVFGADQTVRKLVPAPDGAHWSEFQRGKHFPAMEAPAQLAADLQACFAPLQ